MNGRDQVREVGLGDGVVGDVGGDHIGRQTDEGRRGFRH